MATINVGSGRSGKKPVDADIPLIPFIDLLLCCVMFLLVTAVWNQLASIDLVQRVPGESTIDEPPERLTLLLQVTPDGYVVSSSAGDRLEIPKHGDAYDAELLGEKLAVYRERDPAHHGLTVSVDDGIPVQFVIQAMDTARSSGFTALALSDT